MNYVPFAERSLEVVVDLYQKTACHKAVVNEKVLQNIIKTLRIPLSLKYSCPSQFRFQSVLMLPLSILPSYTEAVLTSLQEAVLTALDVLQKAICVGSEICR